MLRVGFDSYFEIAILKLPEKLPSLQGHHLAWKEKETLVQLVLNICHIFVGNFLKHFSC